MMTDMGTDAEKWAKEFCERYHSAFCQIVGKEGVTQGSDFEDIMRGWFANAIMAGYEEGHDEGYEEARDDWQTA